MAFTDREVRNVLHRLRGQPCTPPGTPREIVSHVQAEGLAKFHQWPSGHWQITERGANYLAETAERDGRDDAETDEPVVTYTILWKFLPTGSADPLAWAQPMAFASDKEAVQVALDKFRATKPRRCREMIVLGHYPDRGTTIVGEIREEKDGIHLCYTTGPYSGTCTILKS